MSTNDNLELMHRMYEALNTYDLEAHDKYWTEDMIWHGPPGWGVVHGRDSFKYDVQAEIYKGFPDYHAVNVIELAEGDLVAATGYFTGTHEGDWNGIPPTGIKIEAWFSDFWRVEGDRLAENWVMIDMLGILQQLGAVPGAPKPRSRQFKDSETDSVSTKENLELMHRMYEALNTYDLEAHDKYWTEDMIWHGPPEWGDVHGRDSFKYDVQAEIYKGFPDYHAINIVELAEGNLVAATGYYTGTHKSDWFGIPPTGKKIEGWFSDFWRVEGDRLAENWVMIDMLGILQQLGIDPLAQTKG